MAKKMKQSLLQSIFPTLSKLDSTFKATYKSNEIQGLRSKLSDSRIPQESRGTYYLIEHALKDLEDFRIKTRGKEIKKVNLEFYNRLLTDLLRSFYLLSNELKKYSGGGEKETFFKNIIEEIYKYGQDSIRDRMANLDKKRRFVDMQDIQSQALAEAREIIKKYPDEISKQPTIKTSQYDAKFDLSFSWNDLENGEFLGEGSFADAYKFTVPEGDFCEALRDRGLLDPGCNIIVVKKSHGNPTEAALKEFRIEANITTTISKRYQERKTKDPHAEPPIVLGVGASVKQGEERDNAKFNEVIFSKYAPEGKFSSYIRKLRQEAPDTDWAEFCLDSFDVLLKRLNAFHQEGFLHKDLALRNILTSGVGKNTKPILSDQGLSKPFDITTDKAIIEPRETGPIRTMALISLTKRLHDRGTELYALQLIMLQIIARCAGISSHKTYMREGNFHEEYNRLGINVSANEKVQLSEVEFAQLHGDINSDQIMNEGIQRRLKAALYLQKQAGLLSETDYIRLIKLMAASEKLLSVDDSLTPSQKIARALEGLNEARATLNLVKQAPTVDISTKNNVAQMAPHPTSHTLLVPPPAIAPFKKHFNFIISTKEIYGQMPPIITSGSENPKLTSPNGMPKENPYDRLPAIPNFPSAQREQPDQPIPETPQLAKLKEDSRQPPALAPRPRANDVRQTSPSRKIGGSTFEIRLALGVGFHHSPVDQLTNSQPALESTPVPRSRRALNGIPTTPGTGISNQETNAVRTETPLPTTKSKSTNKRP